MDGMEREWRERGRNRGREAGSGGRGSGGRGVKGEKTCPWRGQDEEREGGRISGRGRRGRPGRRELEREEGGMKG